MKSSSPSSIVLGDTGTLFNMMDQFVSMGYETIFSPYGGTHNEAPKCKSVAPLALKNAYLWLR